MAINDINRNLGPSSNQSHTSEAIGHAEDLSPIITNIDPDQSFFLTEFSTGDKAETLKFAWPLDKLDPPGVNAHLEKEDYTSAPGGHLEYKENTEQFFITYGEVTEAQRKVKKAYKPQDEFERQFAQKMIKHARDIEYAIVHNTVSRQESGENPALTGGIPFFMQLDKNPVAITTAGLATTTNDHHLQTGDFVYFQGIAKTDTGMANNVLYYVEAVEGQPKQFYIYNTIKDAVEKVTANRVKPQNAVANTAGYIVTNNVIDLDGADFELDDLDTVMAMVDRRGGSPDLLVMSNEKKRRFSALVTAKTTINRNMSKSRKIDLVADVVETDFGVLTAKTHHYMPYDTLLILDKQYWKHRWFEPTHRIKDIPKVGTYDRFGIQSWYGLEGTCPKANAAIVGVKRQSKIFLKQNTPSFGQGYFLYLMSGY